MADLTLLEPQLRAFSIFERETYSGYQPRRAGEPGALHGPGATERRVLEALFMA
jgi:hypothetical protein